MYIGVKSVKAIDNYKLIIIFENNKEKLFDMNNYLEYGLFKELKDEKLFKTVHVNFDSIEWENGADIDPEILYSESIELTQSST
jgi:Protein of unknown function (DUF2442)